MEGHMTKSTNSELTRESVRRRLFYESEGDDSGDEAPGQTRPTLGGHPAPAYADGNCSRLGALPFKSSDSTVRGQPRQKRVKAGVVPGVVVKGRRPPASINWGAVAVVVLMGLLIWATFWYNMETLRTEVQWHRHRGELYLHVHGHHRVYITGFIVSVLMAVAIGTGCCCISGVVTYFDSHSPGKVPPTPLSPTKYRQLSGHTFHSNYIMCFLNSIMASLYALWWQRRSYLFM